nr:MAG TPA: hypothetical protein [Caudoviricetes sp.]
MPVLPTFAHFCPLLPKNWAWFIYSATRGFTPFLPNSHFSL